MDTIIKKHAINPIKNLEIIGAATGIAGALIMSFTPEMAFISWSVWLVSSLSLFVFAMLSGLRYLMALQFVFTVINMTGIFNTATLFFQAPIA
jgi:hypothetical protein